MPERVTIREDLHIIQVDSYGEVSAQDLRQALDEVVRIREDRGLSNVFVDASEQTSLPSTMPAFEFGSALAERVRGMRVAVVGTPKLTAEMRFMETVARNRGAQLRIFDSAETALAWLVEERGTQGAEDDK